MIKTVVRKLGVHNEEKMWIRNFFLRKTFIILNKGFNLHL